MELTKNPWNAINELVTREDDLEREAPALVSLSKKFITLDGKTGYVELSRTFDLSNPEKILLLLIGKFLAEKINLAESSAISMKEISTGLNILITTVSAPLGNLVREGTIEKSDEGLYAIKPRNIKNILGELNKKYSD